MRVEVFGGGELFDGCRQRGEALRAEFLHGHAFAEVGEAEAGVGFGVAVGGQNVVGAAGVVAHAFGRVGAEEDGTGVVQIGQERAWLGGLYDEVFGRVGVADGDALREVGGDDDAAVCQRLPGGGGARQGGELGGCFLCDLAGEFARGCNQHYLGIGAVFGL